jgi:glycogen operon protein
MKTIDQNSLTLLQGKPAPMGCSITNEGKNFAIFSDHPEILELIVFTDNPQNPKISIPLDSGKNKSGKIWHIEIIGLPDIFEYGYRLTGKDDKIAATIEKSPPIVLNDPCARAYTGGEIWGSRNNDSSTANLYRSLYISEPFDWEDDQPLNIPLSESIIYELHTRGFTKHSSSNVKYPGTYAGLIEKIPYLKSLGITAIELLPINEFDETRINRTNPQTGEKLFNFWGYDSLGFFAPKAAYARQPHRGGNINEFKLLVKEMHKARIEIILDIVFNHTGEGPHDHPTFSFRGLANSTYYIVDHKSGHYLDFTGCGNTVNCNHPVVTQMILDVLRYWVTEMHIDGFRFDLVSILTRDSNGAVLENPPIIEKITKDPILKKSKLIAEAWDAAGLYQVGSFPGGDRWAIWNDRFRDTARKYVRGDSGLIPDLATRIAGSADLFRHMGRFPYHSINYITAHDGFPLSDVMSYSKKHNLMNGERNADGMNENYSNNYGHEGPTPEISVNALRLKQIKNMAALLLLSQGVPMILAGDEVGRTQQGNNNGYCQDNEISWINWNYMEKNSGLLRFFKTLIQFRKNHPAFHRKTFFEDDQINAIKIQWYDNILNPPNWGGKRHSLAYHLLPVEKDTDMFIISNSGRKKLRFQLPKLKAEKKWHLVMDTNRPEPEDIFERNHEILLVNQDYYMTEARSTVLLIGKENPKNAKP